MPNIGVFHPQIVHFVIALLVVASVTGWAGIGLAIVLHEGSTLVVVLNALRLLGYRSA